MSRYEQYPFLDVSDARRDADQALADMVRYVEDMQIETEGAWPPSAGPFLADIQAVRELLALLIPPEIQAMIDTERQAYEDEAERWEPSSY